MGIRQKGKDWWIDYYVHGRRKRKKIGPSKKLAINVLKDVHVKIAKGEYLGVYEDKKILFEEYAKEYLDYSKSNKSPSSHRRDQVSLNPNLIPAFKGHYLYGITSHMIEKYKAERLKQAEPGTVNREVGCLRHMFNTAVRWGYVKRSPAHGVKMLKEPPGRVRYLDTKEIEALMKAMNQLTRGAATYLKPIVVMALNTGMRKAEILTLKWAQVDLKGRKITVVKTKNNEVRTIPINETLFEELQNISRHPESPQVFFHPDGDAFKNVRKSFAKVLKEAKIQDFVFHDLRHTFASHLVMSGCNLRTIQQLMGHKDIKMTMRYSHLSKEHLQDAVAKLDSIWTLYGHQQENSVRSNSATH